MGLRFFDKHPVGVLSTRVTSDVESIEQFFSSGVAAFFHDILKLLLILVVLFVVNAQLAAVVCSVLPVLAITLIFTRRSRRDFGHVRTETARANGFTTEAINGIRVTRIFGREPNANARFADHTQVLQDAHFATIRNFAYFFPTVNVLSSLAVTLVIHFLSLIHI